ncbi:MAG: SurA N-terminal domain-containing protein [Desulfobacterales bacterium]|nr:SurA N-terminal domain-containing protein [Desulfobacterales bacterium]
MLGYLRERSGSWIIKIILGFIIIIFAFFFGVGGFGPKGQGPVAMVNDQAISFEEYKQSYESIVEQYRTRLGDNYDPKILEQYNVKQNALDRLIEEKLVLIAAKNFGVKASGKEIADSLKELSFFQTDSIFDFDKYKKVLANNSMTPEMFELSQKKLITQQKIRNLIFDTVIVSDMEALKWHKYLNTKVSINYIKFDPVAYTEINPSHEAVKNYYIDNRENYKTDVKLNVEYLKFSTEDYKEKIKTTNKELEEYYEENSQLYNIPEKVEARHILIKTDQALDKNKIEEKRKEAMKIYEMAIDKENKFEELAKKYSEGPSNSNGGYLGSFAKDEMVEPFSDKAFSMKAGEISEPVKTRFGWHIIKVLAKLEPSKKFFNDAKDEIEKIILEKKISDLAYYDAGDAFDAVIDGDSLEQAGLITKRKVLEMGPFTENGAGIGSIDNSKFAKAAFSTMINEISNIVEIDNSYYLIKPIERIEPEVIEFEVIQEKVKADIIVKMQNEKAEKLSNDILLLSKENKTLSEIAKNQNLKLETSELFGRNGYIPEIGYTPSISEASFKLAKMDEIYLKTLKMDNIFYVISLKEKSVPKDFKDAEEGKTIKAKLEDQKKNTIYSAWIGKLKTVNEVKIMMPELFK